MEGLLFDETCRSVRDAAEAVVNVYHDLDRVRRFRDHATGFDAGAWKMLAADGWLAACSSEDLGGSNLPLTAVAAIQYVIGHKLAIEPYVALCTSPVRVASAISAGHLLEGIHSGADLVAVAWQEYSGHISNTEKIETFLCNGKVYGTKKFVAAGAVADKYLVTLLHSGRLKVAVVDRQASGVKVSTNRQIDGSLIAEIVFDGVTPMEIHQANPVDLDRVVCEARVLLSAQLVGGARQALKATLDYICMREQFDHKIGSFQVVRHRCVDLGIQLRLAEVSCDAALSTLDNSSSTIAEIARASSIAKAGASEAAIAITQGAVQLHGAIGYTDEADIGLYLASALTLAPHLGTSEALRDYYLRLGGE